MKCPSCGNIESKVIDSRPSADGKSIRRRRECLECGKRFTTYEIVETPQLVVIKKDQTVEPFERNKILNSIIHACDKRHVTLAQMEAVVDEIESVLQNSLQNEVQSEHIGEMVMERLKNLDEVAYVRFASVYRQFRDIDAFMEELKRLMLEK